MSKTDEWNAAKVLLARFLTESDHEICWPYRGRLEATVTDYRGNPFPVIGYALKELYKYTSDKRQLFELCGKRLVADLEKARGAAQDEARAILGGGGK